MTIHICCPDDRHIVPRMAHWLAEGNGWSISERPEPGAALNYFMPYLAWAAGPRIDTRQAGWFTHHEPGTAKGEIWLQTAHRFDLRCTAAPLYLDNLRSYGRAVLITAGVDQEHFSPRHSRKKSKRPVIGFSGVGQPRKGIELANGLQEAGLRAELTAAGRDWGDIPATWIDYRDMPAFYSGLSVYVCTAVIEGIPAPPLEALACGIKVVIPAGVGMLGELPEMEGVRHYTAGNYDSLLTALHLALADEVAPAALRDVVAPYTVQAWCDSTRAAVEELLESK